MPTLASRRQRTSSGAGSERLWSAAIRVQGGDQGVDEHADLGRQTEFDANVNRISGTLLGRRGDLGFYRRKLNSEVMGLIGYRDTVVSGP